MPRRGLGYAPRASGMVQRIRLVALALMVVVVVVVAGERIQVQRGVLRFWLLALADCAVS